MVSIARAFVKKIPSRISIFNLPSFHANVAERFTILALVSLTGRKKDSPFAPPPLTETITGKWDARPQTQRAKVCAL